MEKINGRNGRNVRRKNLDTKQPALLAASLHKQQKIDERKGKERKGKEDDEERRRKDRRKEINK
jgi:hypothetical protein